MASAPALCIDRFDEIVRENGSRASVLERIIDQLESFPADVDDREAFVHIFRNAKAVLELTDLDLAKTLRVARPTIGRWERGESAPHRLARRPIFMALARMARSKLRAHRSI
jgi:DNA-binding XRE family transcriptional regulator